MSPPGLADEEKTGPGIRTRGVLAELRSNVAGRVTTMETRR